MKNHLSDNRIAEYVDALAFDRETFFDKDELKHIEECAECRDKILDVSLFFSEESENTPASLEEEYIYETVSRYNKDKNPFMRSFMKVAAAFLVTFGLYYSWMIVPGADTGEIKLPVVMAKESSVQEQKVEITDKKSVRRKASAAKTTRVKSLRNKFTLNRNLERMVGSIYRSGSVNIITPDNRSIFKTGSKVEFKWKGIKPDNHSLKIVNNLNETVYEFNAQDNCMKIELNMDKGLYYWKLESETDLLYVGRFVVK